MAAVFGNAQTHAIFTLNKFRLLSGFSDTLEDLFEDPNSIFNADQLMRAIDMLGNEEDHPPTPEPSFAPDVSDQPGQPEQPLADQAPQETLNKVKIELSYDEPCTSFPPQGSREPLVTEIKADNHVFMDIDNPLQLVNFDPIGIDMESRSAINIFLEKQKKTGRPKS